MNFRIVCFLLTFFVSITACKKHDDNVFLANETTAGFDGYSFTDTFSLITSTVREDSLKSDSLSHNLVGVINDAVFGKYEASSFFQFKMPQVGNVISSNTLDSVVLFMQFTSTSSYYGDLNSTVSFDVFELNESMGSSVTHSTQSYNYDPTPIGTFTGVFDLDDSMNVNQLGTVVKGAPGVSIKLSSAFAQKMFNANATNLSSQENFLQFMKGIAVVPKGTPAFGSGVIAGFNMKGSYSKIRIYYNGNQQSDFIVLDDCERFSQYKVSNQGTEISSQKAFGGMMDFDTTYVQAMAGAKTQIKIPNLFGIIKNNGKFISVGKAEVIIRPLAGSFASPFNLPTRMLIFQQDEVTKLNAGIIDLIEPFYGGSYDAAKNEYRFNITRYIQSLYTDFQKKNINNNRGLFLTIPSDFPIAPSRIMIDARKGIPNAGIEFRLVYTEL